MVEYFIASKSDMDLLMKSRMEMLQIVNGLSSEYIFDKKMIDSSIDYFANGNQTTVLARDKDIIGCATICYIDMMPTFSHPTGKRAHLMNVYTNVNYRRKGIAIHMIDMLVVEAKEKGVTEISLDATELGRHLYKKYGFIESNECMVLSLG